MAKGIVITPDNRISEQEFPEPIYDTVGKVVGGWVQVVRPEGLAKPFCMRVDDAGNCTTEKPFRTSGNRGRRNVKNPIYTPTGAAREYGEYALNIYTGCPHRCPYCYAPQVLHKDRETFHGVVEPRPGIVEAVREQLERTGMTGNTVHLCFTCDPFPSGYDCTPTLDIIRLLKERGNHVQILTKGNGSPCLDLLDENDCYGVTMDGSESGTPVAAMRISSIIAALKRGIKTWVSYEPVLDPQAVLDYIEISGKCFNRVAIGKLNYCQPPEPVDWGAFGREAEALCQRMGLDYYIKASLRKEMERHG